MKEKILKGKKVYLRYPKIEDFAELTELNKASVDFHKGLANPPKDKDSFTEFVEKNERPENECFLICSIETDEIAGAINLSQIFRAGFQNAYLGY
jgi:RimJ/RimL family protein N-acetyltransferase